MILKLGIKRNKDCDKGLGLRGGGTQGGGRRCHFSRLIAISWLYRDFIVERRSSTLKVRSWIWEFFLLFSLIGV